MFYKVLVANEQMEEHTIDASSPLVAAKKAAAISAVDMIPCLGRAAVTIRVEWNHHDVPRQDDALFGGLLATVEAHVACDTEYFYWDENGVTPETDDMSIIGEHE